MNPQYVILFQALFTSFSHLSVASIVYLSFKILCQIKGILVSISTNVFLLFLANHCGRKISNPVSVCSEYFSPRYVNGHCQLFISRIVPSNMTREIAIQSKVPILSFIAAYRMYKIFRTRMPK